MGCDSHLAIEYRPYPERHPELWYAWAVDITQDRNYRMFAAMAGVRNYAEPPIVPVSEPRGLPENLDNSTQEFLRFADHSFTWLTPEEYCKAFMRANPDESEGENFAKSWRVLYETLLLLEKYYGPDNVRLLVGFDN